MTPPPGPSTSGLNEASTVQAPILAVAAQAGMRRIDGRTLDLPAHGLLLEELEAALATLNPTLAEGDRRQALRRIVVEAEKAIDEATLHAVNEVFTDWIRDGLELRIRDGGQQKTTRVRLLDHDQPLANRWIAVDELTIPLRHADGRSSHGRLDVVIYANGFPLVAAEAKSPFGDASWLTAACELTGENDGSDHPVSTGYIPGSPAFFAANLLLVGTDGRELRVGALGQPAAEWLPWRSLGDPEISDPLNDTARSIELLFDPALLTDIAAFFARFAAFAGARKRKVLPRYAQVDAVRAFATAIEDPQRRQGLLRLYQGSGKTLLVGYLAAHALRALDAPTVIAVVDRNDLNSQTVAEIEGASLLPVKVAETRDELRRLVAEQDRRGFIIANVQLFEKPDLLTDRSDVVVIADEAHRTQEGLYGTNLRAALPNARLFGLTGTTIDGNDRNTYKAFADERDPNGLLADYTISRSLRDGVVVPLVVERRKLSYDVDRGLDLAFDALAEREGVDERYRERAKRALATREQLLSHPDRVAAFARDVVDHYLANVREKGMKGMIVVEDRPLCVAVNAAVEAYLDEIGLPGLQTTVVMSGGAAGGKRIDPADLARYARPRKVERLLLNDYANPAHPLTFLVVTDKLLTGFNAPVAGVMYLDKIVRGHNLAQAAARVNRRWTGTGTEKTFGLIVDYVGCGGELTRALAAQTVGSTVPVATSLEALIADCVTKLDAALARFAGIDIAADPNGALFAAAKRIAGTADRDAFLAEAAELKAYWRTLWPDVRLRSHRVRYDWLQKLAKAQTPPDAVGTQVVGRLADHARRLITESVGSFDYSGGARPVTLDQPLIEKVAIVLEAEQEGIASSADVKAILTARLRALFGSPSAERHYTSLVALLERLRDLDLFEREGAERFVLGAIEVGQGIIAAKREIEQDAPVVAAQAQPRDPRVDLVRVLELALLERGEDDVPGAIRRVFDGITEIGAEYAYENWQAKSLEGVKPLRNALRKLLRESGFEGKGELFEAAWAFIVDNY
jgi:type I restriction enzyme R subunit